MTIRILKIFGKILASLLVILLLSGVFALWKLSKGPLELNFLKANIEEFVPGISFQSLFLDWKNLHLSPVITLNGVTYQNNSLKVEAHKALLKLNFWSLVFNKLQFKQISLERAEIDIIAPPASNQNPSSHLLAPLYMLFEKAPETKKWFYETLPHIEFFKCTIRHHTPSTVYELRKLSGSLESSSNTLTARLLTEAHIENLHVPIEIYIEHKDHLGLRVRFSNFSPSALKEALKLSDPFFDFYKHPLSCKFEMHFTKNKEIIEGNVDGKLYLYYGSPQEDDALPFIALPFNVTAQASEANLTYEGRVSLTTLPLNALGELWPSTLGISARNWFLSSIKGGNASSASCEVSGNFDFSTKAHTLTNLKGHIDLDNTSVDYVTGMPPTRETTASALYTDKLFDITIQKGKVGRLNVTSGKVFLKNLDQDVQQGEVTLDIKGPLEDALWIIDHPPLHYGKKYNFSPSQARGSAAVKLNLQFPLSPKLSFKDVRVNIEGDVTNGSLKQSLMNQPLLLEGLRFHLQVSNKGLLLKGHALFHGKDAKITWQEVFDSKQPYTRLYHIKTYQKIEDLLPYGLSFLKDYVGDFVGAEMTYTAFEKDAILLFNADVSDTLITVPALDIYKTKNGRGHIKGKLIFKDEKLYHLQGLDIALPSFETKGDLFFTKGELSRLLFPHVKTEKSLYSIEAKTKALGEWHATLKAKTIDCAPYLDALKGATSDKNGSSPRFRLQFTADQAFLKNEIILRGVKGFYEKQPKGTNFSMQADFGKGSYINLKYMPNLQQKKQQLIGQTNNLGTLLKGLDITKGIIEGKARINAEYDLAKGSSSPLKGKMHLEKIQSKDMPLLASILTITSFTDMLTLLKGDGIIFDEGKIKFSIEKDKIIVEDSIIHNSSIGLTGYGLLDLEKEQIKFEGVVVPAYTLNKLLGYIPLLGQLLSGGKPKEGVFSFFYHITGPLKDPQVAVNPLSALTPGFLKNILKDKPTSTDADKK